MKRAALTGQWPVFRGPATQDAWAQPVDAARLPVLVAGIRLQDSKIAGRAVALAQFTYPRYLFNHEVRTLLLGSLAGRARGQRFDEELLFLACILHDLGLAERFQGGLPFEIQVAEAANHFLKKRHKTEGVETVWDEIAMHASAMGRFKRPEIAFGDKGAGIDVLEPDFSQIKKTDVAEVVKAFPRRGFKVAFVQTCGEVVRSHPRSASRSFMRDSGERCVRNFHPHKSCDLLAQSPFSE